MNIPPVFQDVEIKQSQNWLFTYKFEKLNFNKEKELEDTDFNLLVSGLEEKFWLTTGCSNIMYVHSSTNLLCVSTILHRGGKVSCRSSTQSFRIEYTNFIGLYRR